MTIFGKVLIGLMLATAAVLIIRGAGKTEDMPVIETPSETPTTTSDTAADNKFNGSLSDLQSRGGDYKCSFVQTNDGSDSTGTIYISGKKMRGDFNTTVKLAADMKVESHMISDGEFIYNWSSMVPTGFKMAIDQDATATPSTSQSFDYNQKLDYDCEVWTKDEAKFALPTEIKFTAV